VSAYREGLRAALELHDERLRRGVARAGELPPAVALPEQYAAELAALRARLAVAPTNGDELARAEVALERYERLLDEAFALAAQRRAAEALGAPRRRQRLLYAGGALLVTGLAFVWWRLGVEQEIAEHAAQCRENEWSCKQWGQCDARPRDVWREWYDCIATNDADCRASTDCAKQGKCTAVDERCQPTRDEDCLRSRVCAEEGQCSADSAVYGRYCAATDSARCRALPACREKGACTATGGACRPGSDEECAASAACLARGACTRKDDHCALVGDADCRRTVMCKERGLCAAFEGTCVDPRDLACLSSLGCTYAGLCTQGEGRCVARSDARCRSSTHCALSGLCKAAGDRCVADADADCRASEGCRRSGLCVASGGKCVEESDAGR
jgi:hypothetical protein